MKWFSYANDLLRGKRSVSPTSLLLVTSLFLVAFDNRSFFAHVLDVYPLSPGNIGFLTSLGVGLAAVIMLLLTLVSSRYTLKPVLISLLMVSSITAYFMDNLNVVIDHIMIQNIAETNWSEASDLLSVGLVFDFVLLGVLPSWAILRVKIDHYSLKKAVFRKTRDAIIAIVVIFAMLLPFSKFYTSFFREHKPLRYYTNPTYTIYSCAKYINRTYNVRDTAIARIGLDARVVEPDGDEDDGRTELVILVVGEAARADHFSLNGYQRDTNPLLKKENVINFSNMYSCGTSTAYSVPCMFSVFPRREFNNNKGVQTENLLDVLSHTGFVDILWRDNNSDSKGVALRNPYEDYRIPDRNPICPSGECRDEGMLVGLDQYIAQHKGKDMLIVLHQMGNHGPAYYKRYPAEFEKFTPVCKTNQIEACSQEEIINAYDNALLYTDYFLAQVIHFLKNYDATHETAMIYMSDHGESLGEKGVYLHGIPYIIAPDAQTHVAGLMWFGEAISKEIDLEKVKRNKDQPCSHDNLFHTLLGLFEVKTDVYDQAMDMLNQGPE